MLLAVLSVALAQPVAAVPPGSGAVTVFLCPRTDGCAVEWRALAAHMRALSLPLLDFDAVAAAGAGGRDALARYEAAMAPIRRGQSGDALAALQDLPFTVPSEDLFLIHLQQAARLHPSAEADRAFAAAASVSERRVYDLPRLPTEVVARYLDIATAPAPAPADLEVVADVEGARVYVDGRPFSGGPVEAGWHRVSVERSGRLTAWTGIVELPPQKRVTIVASVAGDDGAVALEAALIAARHGAPPPVEVNRALGGWARANGLAWVRFVELVPPGDEIPEEHVPAEDPATPPFDLVAVYLDAASGRLSPRGPGPAALLVAADTDRFRLGLSLGFLHVGELKDTDFAPNHDHLTAELAAQVRFSRDFALDVRVGIAHAAQAYYLDEDWLDRNVYPVTAGLRLGRQGPYAVVSGIAIVPYALGAQALLGWDFAPSTSWRLAPELRGGVTDRGWFAGGSLVVVRRR